MENEGVQMPGLGAGMMLGKLHCDSAWAGLTPEKREMLEGWLFEENLGYTEVLERAQREFGVTASKMSLSRYYQRLAAERAHRELLDLGGAVKELKAAGIDRAELNAAVVSLLAKRLLKLLLESPDKVKEMAWLGNVLVGNEAQEIKRGWLAIGKMKAELDIAAECLKHKTELDAIAAEEGVDEEELVLRIRRHLFGTNLPT